MNTQEALKIVRNMALAWRDATGEICKPAETQNQILAAIDIIEKLITCAETKADNMSEKTIDDKAIEARTALDTQHAALLEARARKANAEADLAERQVSACVAQGSRCPALSSIRTGI